MTQTTDATAKAPTPIAPRAKRRHPVSIVCLYAITLGFYGIYLWYVFNRDLRDLGRNRGALGFGEAPVVSTLAFLLGKCLLVPYLWTAVTTSRRTERATALVGVRERFRPAVVVALLAAGCAATVATGLSTTWVWVAALVLSVVFEVAGLCVMQAALNRVWAACGIGPRPPAAGPPLRRWELIPLEYPLVRTHFPAGL